MVPSGRRVRIARGNAAVRDFVERPEPLLGLPVPNAEGSSGTLGEHLAQTLTDAFLVLHDGDLVLEWYARAQIRDTPQALMSVTKSVIGCLAGMLVTRGKLDPDRLASSWVREVAGSGYAAVTVRDLLDMRTGTDYRESYDDPEGEVVHLGSCLSGASTKGLHGLVTGTGRLAHHAGPFCYRSLDTELLGWVVERAASKSIAELVEQRVLTPLGAEHDASLAVDALGTGSASGGLAMTARDVARFGQMLLDGGAVSTRQVVPTEWIKDIRVGASDSVDAFRERAQGGPAADALSPPTAMYRNQFWVLEQGGHEFVALGIYGQYVHVNGDAGTVVVKLSSWPQPQDPQRFTDGLACAEAVAEHLEGRPHSQALPVFLNLRAERKRHDASHLGSGSGHPCRQEEGRQEDGR